ncbi:hypothetical protein [Ancylobacter sp. FA202]|uniref:hypothetical protein n=1 Tax=Ancylobacter sp. FA202 TaxID=1111106 RepID=UPI0003775C14|nr:hypothetical protein [Ancylobacter sp. FA202]
MLAHKFDIDSSSLSFDRQQGRLAMKLQPVVPDYDEAAVLVHGWGVMAGCPQVRRLVVDVVEVDAVPLPSMPARHAS